MIDSLLSIEKLLDFAIRLEEIGEKFFMEWAEKAESDDVKKFFRFLAEEESEHKKIFKKLREKTGVIQNNDIKIQEEHIDFFDTFANTILFNEKEMNSVKNLAEAIELAKKQEVDAQLFFSDLIKYLSKENIDTVKQIIEEELNHFDKLVKLENKLFKTKNL